ncbi:MAG: hypothetical protein SVS15_04150 [Thermodesulfobacteriota bacterium]|nr:hypothetical protein [Thermodesulfobacteriota bacterium]
MEKTDWSRVYPVFKREEWRHDPDKVLPDLVYLCHDIRLEACVPFVIHEAWCSWGHREGSRHFSDLLEGRVCADAVDFHFGVNKLADPPKQLTFKQQFHILNSRPQIGGIGFYPRWKLHKQKRPGWHIDFRFRSPGRPLYWLKDIGGYTYSYDPERYLLPRLRHMDLLEKDRKERVNA